MQNSKYTPKLPLFAPLNYPIFAQGYTSKVTHQVPLGFQHVPLFYAPFYTVEWEYLLLFQARSLHKDWREKGAKSSSKRDFYSSSVTTGRGGDNTSKGRPCIQDGKSFPRGKFGSHKKRLSSLCQFICPVHITLILYILHKEGWLHIGTHRGMYPWCALRLFLSPDRHFLRFVALSGPS